MREPSSPLISQGNGIFKYSKNICLLLLICSFIFAIVIIFYIFIDLMENPDIVTTNGHYEITDFSQTNTSITVIAKCTLCPKYYKESYNQVSKMIKLTIVFLDKNKLNLEIKGISTPYSQFEIPKIDPFINFINKSEEINFKKYYKIILTYNPLNIKIQRTSTQEIILDTKKNPIIFSQFYIQIAYEVSTNFVSGLGERYSLFKLKSGIYTIWNKKQDFTNNNQNINQKNSHGSQPIYLVKENSDLFHVAYLKNFNAMDIKLNITEKNTFFEYRILGGTFNITFIFGKKDPNDLIINFHKMIGGWIIPPLWSFGLSHLATNYNNADDLLMIIDNYNSSNFHLDNLWIDYEYMMDQNSFTIDSSRFPPDKMLNISKNFKLIVNIVPCVKIDTESTAYFEGIQLGIFLKYANKQIFKGKNKKVGNCHYPDFFSVNAKSYWSEMLQILNTHLNFSGIWLDDNQIYDLSKEKNNFKNSPNYEDNFSEFPYLPGNISLSNDTIDLNLIHDTNIYEFNVHSLFAIHEIFYTHSYLKEILKTPYPFIMSVGNSIGFGKYSGHLDDNIPFEWDFLKYYLAQILNFNFFGNPYSGGFLCGGQNINDNFDYELCARWIQLSTFFPLFLIKLDSKTKNFFLKGDLANIFEKTITLRYQLLLYIYTLYLKENGNGSIMKPLFFYFYSDSNAYNEKVIQNQYMLGDYLMINPILEKSTNTIFPYFPKENWYDFYQCKEILNNTQSGQYKEINNSITDYVPTFFIGGNIIAMSVNNKNDKISVKYLNLYISFKTNKTGDLVSHGDIFISDNIYNDENMKSECKDNKCILSINAHAKFIKGNSDDLSHYEIILNFSSKTNEIKNTQSFINNLKFYGLNKQKCLGFSLPTSMQIRTPNSISIKIYE